MAHAHLTDEQLEYWKDLKGNFTFTPNYVDLVRGIGNTLSWYYAPHMWRDYRFPQSFVDDFVKHFSFPLHQVFYILFIAVAITALRYVFEEYLCKVRRSPVEVFASMPIVRVLAVGQLVRPRRGE